METTAYTFGQYRWPTKCLDYRLNKDPVLHSLLTRNKIAVMDKYEIPYVRGVQVGFELVGFQL